MCEYEVDFQKVSENLKIFKKWLVTQEHLPDIDDNYVRNAIICCNYDIEQTKSLMEKCFTLRMKAPDIFRNRDCLKENVWDFLINSDLTIMPKLTKENYSVKLYRYLSDYRKLTMEGCFKGMSLISDLQLCRGENFPIGTIDIHDLGLTGIMHVTKSSFSVIKKFMTYAQEAHPLRLKQVHIINVPFYWGKLYTILKPFIRLEVANLIHIHSNYQTLYEFVPKEFLPKDYGGELDSLETFKDYWLKKLEDNRDFFLDDSKWMIDESKLQIQKCDP